MTPEPIHVRAFIGLGANLGASQEELVARVREAVGQIAALPQTRLVHTSDMYVSAPVDASGADYVNAVVEVSTSLAPLELLHALQHLEQLAGRQRPYRNAPRTLDLDILLYGDLRLDLPELTVPHPRMAARAFVLLPLAQIAPHRVKASQLDEVKGQRVARIFI